MFHVSFYGLESKLDSDGLIWAGIILKYGCLIVAQPPVKRFSQCDVNWYEPVESG